MRIEPALLESDVDRRKVNYENYTIADVTNKPHIWKEKDPVRPELSEEFRVSSGRKVFALVSKDNFYVAFLCLARTIDVPKDTKSLDSLSSFDGPIAVPYTVWSYKAGAGKEIVSRIISAARLDPSIKRVVTLSPITEVARRFHIKNNAREYRKNSTTVNFEYEMS